MDIDEQIIGCIIGLAAGDALGAPLDGSKPGSVKTAFKTVSDYVDAEDILGDKLFRWRTPGLYGAPAQQALALLEVTLEKRRFDCDAAAAALVKLSCGDSQFQYGVFRGAPPELRDGIEKLKPGYNQHFAGVPYPGCAPAARIAPVAIHHRAHKHLFIDKIIESCIITHRSPLSISAAAAVARIIVDLLDGNLSDAGGAKRAAQDAAGFCRETEDILAARFASLFDGLPEDDKSLHAFSASMSRLADSISEPQEKIDAMLAELANPFANFELKRPTLDFALSAVPRAISVFLKNFAEPAKALAATVGQGGAAEASGAITGALCGAAHGENGLPANLREKLANRKQVKARAQMLASGKLARTQLQDIYEMEYSLTRKENEEREARVRKSHHTTKPDETRKKSPRDDAPKEKFDRKKYEKEVKKQKQLAREKYFKD